VYRRGAAYRPRHSAQIQMRSDFARCCVTST
jgi:hypothetical protein